MYAIRVGRAIARAANRQPLTEEARVQTQGAVCVRFGRCSPCNIHQVLKTEVSVQMAS